LGFVCNTGAPDIALSAPESPGYAVNAPPSAITSWLPLHQY
jgi:hypothetical protein